MGVIGRSGVEIEIKPDGNVLRLEFGIAALDGGNEDFAHPSRAAGK